MTLLKSLTRSTSNLTQTAQRLPPACVRWYAVCLIALSHFLVVENVLELGRKTPLFELQRRGWASKGWFDCLIAFKNELSAQRIFLSAAVFLIFLLWSRTLRAASWLSGQTQSRYNIGSLGKIAVLIGVFASVRGELTPILCTRHELLARYFGKFLYQVELIQLARAKLHILQRRSEHCQDRHLEDQCVMWYGVHMAGFYIPYIIYSSPSSS